MKEMEAESSAVTAAVARAASIAAKPEPQKALTRGEQLAATVSGYTSWTLPPSVEPDVSTLPPTQAGGYSQPDDLDDVRSLKRELLKLRGEHLLLKEYVAQQDALIHNSDSKTGKELRAVGRNDTGVALKAIRRNGNKAPEALIAGKWQGEPTPGAHLVWRPGNTAPWQSPHKERLTLHPKVQPKAAAVVRRTAACVLLVCQCASVDRWQPTAYWTTCDGEGSGRSSRLRSEHSKGRTPPPHGRHHKADTWHTVTAAITAVAVPAANAAAISATASPPPSASPPPMMQTGSLPCSASRPRIAMILRSGARRPSSSPD